MRCREFIEPSLQEDDNMEIKGAGEEFNEKVKKLIAAIEEHGHPILEDRTFDKRTLIVYDQKEKNTRPLSADEIKEQIAFRLLAAERIIDLGNCCHYEEITWRGSCLSCKTHWNHVWCKVQHPSIDEILDDVRTCAREAVVLTGISVIAVGPEAALPTFLSYFYPCLIAKGHSWATSISVELESSHHAGNWRCCA